MTSFVGTDGRRIIATAESDREVRLWDFDRAWREHRRLSGHESLVNAICSYNVNGSPRLISVSGDHTARIWYPDQPNRPPIVHDHGAEINVVAVHNDGTLCKAVTGADDGAIREFDPEGDGSFRIIGYHSCPISAISVVQLDGNVRVATGTDDGLVALWDARKMEMTAEIRVGHAISAIRASSSAGELLVAYDSSWALLTIDVGGDKS
jgi:WD40 repeat protein